MSDFFPSSTHVLLPGPRLSPGDVGFRTVMTRVPGQRSQDHKRSESRFFPPPYSCGVEGVDVGSLEVKW